MTYLPRASIVRSASRSSVPGLARATTRPSLIATSRRSVPSGETTSPSVMSRSSIPVLPWAGCRSRTPTVAGRLFLDGRRALRLRRKRGEVGDRLLKRDHVGDLAVHVQQVGPVRLRRSVRDTLDREERAEPVLHGVAGGGPDTAAGDTPGDDAGVHPGRGPDRRARGATE